MKQDITPHLLFVTALRQTEQPAPHRESGRTDYPDAPPSSHSARTQSGPVDYEEDRGEISVNNLWNDIWNPSEQTLLPAEMDTARAGLLQGPLGADSLVAGVKDDTFWRGEHK